jgi:hypothetical protein
MFNNGGIDDARVQCGSWAGISQLRRNQVPSRCGGKNIHAELVTRRSEATVDYIDLVWLAAEYILHAK